MDPEAPTDINPFVADITVKDEKGNMVLGTLLVSIKATDGTVLTSGVVINGTTRLTLPGYVDTALAVVQGNGFYFSSQAQNNVHCDLSGMIQTLGPTGSDPVANAKFTIIKDYVEHSGAFGYDAVTGNYTMNNNDAAYIWTDTFYNVQRGYQLAVNIPISTQELNSGVFDDQTFRVQKYWASGGALGQAQEQTQFTLSKMQFFDLWLGQKLQPTAYGADQPNPSGFTGLDSLASDFSTFLSKDQSYFQTGGSPAQQFSAKVQGLLDTATKIGFPTPQGVIEQLVNFVNGIINAFLSAIAGIWYALVNFVGSVANFVMIVWNNVVGSVLGAAIEVVKNVVTLSINYFTGIISSVFTDATKSPMTSSFEQGINYIRGQSNQSLNQFQNIFPDDLSDISDSLISFGDLFAPINQFSSILELFEFPLIDQIKSLLPLNFIINRITTLLQDILSSIITNILLPLDFINIFSEIQSTTYTTTEIIDFESTTNNIDTTKISINSNDLNPNQVVNSFNFGQFSSLSQWVNSHNPISKINSNYYNESSILGNIAINLESIISSTFYQLMTGFSKDPSAEINNMVIDIVINFKSYFLYFLQLKKKVMISIKIIQSKYCMKRHKLAFRNFKMTIIF